MMLQSGENCELHGGDRLPHASTDVHPYEPVPGEVRRRDDSELASDLRIEERELEAGSNQREPRCRLRRLVRGICTAP